MFRAEQKRWVGAVLHPAEKFVLRLKYLDTQVATGKWDAGKAQSSFEVTIKPSGKNLDRPCNGLAVGDKRTVSIYNDSDGFTCHGSLQQYLFNLKTNRFMALYAVGYVDGADNNDDTPSVAGGVCTKIN